jgi:predicted ATPase
MEIMDYISKLSCRGLNGFDNYIEQIRFPFFKKISRNQEITFDFPFTALVGPNGSGKSSALQALYGACLGKSVSDFWFSTQMDPIKGTGNEINRFIYKFKPYGYDSSVEVLNQRTTSTKRADPDYWETQSPTKRDNMAPMPPLKANQAKFRSKTRWNPINKEVVYIDFRSELSAFDKCFYFGHFEKSISIKNIKDFLRTRSKSLKKIIDNDTFPKDWNSKKVANIYQLTDVALTWSNRILGKNYSEAKIIEHDLFNQNGISIIFNTSGHTYSEAVAGSGEVAVVTSVINILQAKPHSLILLDEPEVSLHPGAQLKLRELLLHKTSSDSCQVVISTHSETFLKGLPNNAIKLFYLDEANQTYTVASEASPDQAFFRLGGMNNAKGMRLYVEDDLAKLLVEEAIKEVDPTYLDDLLVIPHPGGAATIIKSLTVSFALSEAPCTSQLVLLDGDMKRPGVKRLSKDIAENEYSNLNKILAEQTGVDGKNFDLPLDGGNGSIEIQKKQKTKLLLKVLDAFHQHFKFMNTNTPEELVWQISNQTPKMKALCQNISCDDYKERFKELAKGLSTQVNSESILNAQTMMLMNRDSNHEFWLEFKNLLKGILKISDID